jgi:hypothetical protein
MRLLALLLVPVLVAGCMHATGGVAPSNVPLEPGTYVELGPVHGDDCLYALLGILPLSGGNETRRAVEEALAARAGATALVNVTSDTFHQFWLILSRHCTEVHAIAVRSEP